jgi:hypothetical protein
MWLDLGVSLSECEIARGAKIILFSKACASIAVSDLESNAAPHMQCG